MVIHMKDFTRQPKVIEMKIDDDIFRAKPRLPAQTMIDFTLKVESMGDDMDATMGFQTMMDALEMVLIPEHFHRFKDRMKSETNPIDLPQVNEVVEYVMEEYGMRPTQSPSASSTGQPNPVDGISSTASTPDAGSIS